MTLCACGCGRAAPIAIKTYKKHGHVKGEPVRFVRGHARRRDIPDYLVVDRGYTTPCHIWNRGIDPISGYGRTSTGNDAHRKAYVRAHGEPPAGYDVDHLCRQRDCVNDEHLEAVTHSVNCQRGNCGRWSRRAS